LLFGVVEAVGRDGLRPFDPAFVMGMARTDQIDGLRAGIGANTCELSLVFFVFSPADAVADLRKAGKRTGSRPTPTAASN
jgi:hypothetical protein